MKTANAIVIILLVMMIGFMAMYMTFRDGILFQSAITCLVGSMVISALKEIKK